MSTVNTALLPTAMQSDWRDRAHDDAGADQLMTLDGGIPALSRQNSEGPVRLPCVLCLWSSGEGEGALRLAMRQCPLPCACCLTSTQLISGHVRLSTVLSRRLCRRCSRALRPACSRAQWQRCDRCRRARATRVRSLRAPAPPHNHALLCIARTTSCWAGPETRWVVWSRHRVSSIAPTATTSNCSNKLSSVVCHEGVSCLLTLATYNGARVKRTHFDSHLATQPVNGQRLGRAPVFWAGRATSQRGNQHGQVFSSGQGARARPHVECGLGRDDPSSHGAATSGAQVVRPYPTSWARAKAGWTARSVCHRWLTTKAVFACAVHRTPANPHRPSPERTPGDRG